MLKEDPPSKVTLKGESIDSCEGESKKKALVVHEKETKVIECIVDEKEYEWLNTCAIGHVFSLDMIPFLQKIFKMEGY